MATAYVSIGPAGDRSVFSGSGVRSETITTSGTPAEGALVAGASEYVQIFCATGVYARCNGNASMATGIFCPPGLVQVLQIQSGQSVSLIDA